jgi:hypothetical protein
MTNPDHDPPTFAHLDLPSLPSQPQPYQGLGDVIADAQRALEDRHRIVDVDDVAERKRALQPVVEALPPNGRRPRSELLANMPTKLVQVLDAWGGATATC